MFIGNFINSEFVTVDYNIQIHRYSFTRVDHLSNIERGRLGVYYHNFSPLKLINIKYLRCALTLGS